MNAPGPLAGHVVVSLAEQYPGPYAAMLLADLGADVTMVEGDGGTGQDSRGRGGGRRGLRRRQACGAGQRGLPAAGRRGRERTFCPST
ncbi:CoA transferase [Spirillospora sp. NPDC047279]|uniref:CoA transferase n=1 Tax=Spirillospora sp. NPDC047279 TaxID=3155478 RepID=UPI0033CA4D7D